MNGIKAKVIITKSDKSDNQELMSEIKDVFSRINVDVYFVSNKERTGLEEVRKLFTNHITCLIGQTGVGKIIVN